ncbi:MAG: metallophosphoesterase [Bacteroidota bacterium]
MNRFLPLLMLSFVLLLLDFYAFQGIKTATQSFSHSTRNVLHWGYWILTALGILGIFVINFAPAGFAWQSRVWIMVGIFSLYLSKVVIIFFLLIDELVRLVKWVIQKFSGGEADAAVAKGEPISRSAFLAKTGAIAATVPLVGVGFGIISGAHDYRIRRREVYLPNLPKSFDGMRIAQISDIHSGSFWNKTAVQGGVDMLMKEKADVVFFTGDLVNNRADEMTDYVDVFNQIKAPLGVYSTLGNHDYGDYAAWKSPEEKRRNLQTLIDTHRAMGWDILMDEHRMLEESGDKLAIIGIQNWSAKGNFPKYGDLSKAWQGTDEAATKLLLSHDPSHWRAEVTQHYKDIDLTFSGHTHGMQFGVEIAGIKWSPVKYVYKEWADLYQSESEDQYLYVNRGYGYIGFPGRIGMPPEITIMELKKG